MIGFVRVIFVIGIIFGGGMLLSTVMKLIGYNEVIELFQIKNIKTNDYSVTQDSIRLKSLDITYSYEVHGKVYKKKLDVSKRYFEKNFKYGNDSSLSVNYNINFPQLSYIPSLSLEQRKEKVGLVISSVFLAFISLLYLFGNVKKYTKYYEDAGSRPWIYPSNQNEKNLFKRILRMFFKKP